MSEQSISEGLRSELMTIVQYACEDYFYSDLEELDKKLKHIKKKGEEVDNPAKYAVFSILSCYITNRMMGKIGESKLPSDDKKFDVNLSDIKTKEIIRLKSKDVVLKYSKFWSKEQCVKILLSAIDDLSEIDRLVQKPKKKPLKKTLIKSEYNKMSDKLYDSCVKADRKKKSSKPKTNKTAEKFQNW